MFPTFSFASIDPDQSGPPGRRRPTEADLILATSHALLDEGWRALLARCWREIAAETASAVRRAAEHDVLAYAGTVFGVVEHALIELICDPTIRPCGEPRGSLWCAAQALDASALVSHHWRPDAGRRFEALGAALERRIRERSSPPASRAGIAVNARRATSALETLADSAAPTCRALDALDEAAIALAAVGVQTWEAERTTPRLSTTGHRTAVGRGLRMHRHTAELLNAARGEVRAIPAGRDSVGNWLASALARRPPAGPVSVIDDPGADRALRSESLSVLRAAWISRGALELLAIRRLDGEVHTSLRRPARPEAHRTAAVRAVLRPANAPQDAIGAWRRHTLALARAVATYLRACAADKQWLDRTRNELLDLLADSLAHAAGLDALLGYAQEEGGGALDA